MAPIMASFYIVSLLLIAPFAADAAFWSRRGVDSHRTMLVLQQPRGVLSQGARAVTNSCIHALNVIPAAWRLPERCQGQECLAFRTLASPRFPWVAERVGRRCRPQKGWRTLGEILSSRQ